MERISGATLCTKCKEEDKRLQEQAKAQYALVLHDIWQRRIAEEEGGRSLEALSAQARFSDKEYRALRSQAFRSFAEEILADDILSEVEEQRVLSIANLLGIGRDQLESEFRDVFFRLFVARVNDGRLPVIAPPNLILKKGEKAHLSMSAQLMKEVTVTEYRGGYSGFSFRIVRGVRYHVGGVRGRRIVVGTELKEDDKGIIIATSHRAIFLGSKRSLEIPYNKLLSVEVFEDGVRFHLSNRKNAPLFRLENGHPVVAVVNAAMQRLLET